MGVGGRRGMGIMCRIVGHRRSRGLLWRRGGHWHGVCRRCGGELARAAPGLWLASAAVVHEWRQPAWGGSA